MSTKPAARVGDDIAHTRAATGMLLGMLAGAAVGAVLVAATVATGGLALVAAAGAAAGAVSAGGLGGMYIGEAMTGPACGRFVTGSPDVFVNGRPATFTAGSFAQCDKDGTPIPLATGASTVFINSGMAGREGEKLGCSAISIARTSPNVFVGGPSAQDPAVAIQPEVPAWAVTGLQVLGVAGAIAALPYAIATVGVGATVGGGLLGLAGGAGGAVGGRALGEAMGLSEAGTRSLEMAGGFLGGMVGGGLGAKGGAMAQNRLTAARAAAAANRVPPGVPIRQQKFDQLRKAGQGFRDPPETYLPKDYIDGHLAKFDKGGSYLVRTKTLDDWGRDTLGRPDGQFVMPKSEMDDLLARTGGRTDLIEQELGIPAGSWDKPGETLSRIDVPRPRDLDVRMPSGNETGANPLWMPGGKLPGGGSEAVVNQIKSGDFVESIIRPRGR